MFVPGAVGAVCSSGLTGICTPARALQALYARHGFKHVQDKPLGDEEGAPVLKVMIRPPATLASGEGR